ncbi:hypothetical protein B0H34DRAFT_683778 [Crassisporium funariophilum]|nr:hypothetical protein B0H34DRAFT_683778 [Crassisporium funariophilum]
MPSSSAAESTYLLDSSQVAKQMAALTAANQARIAQNTRITPSSFQTPGGTSSGPYLGAINSHSYPAGGHDPLAISTSGHANFQLPNTYGLPPTPNSVGIPSFLDPAMSQQNPLRSQPVGNSSLKQRQHGFLNGLAGLMAKRGTPLPPSLTGVPSPAYDPTNTHWSIIEPSSEVGAFRLAGRDVDLFKLWGLVFQHGGGDAVSNANGWAAILPHFDLPDEFPQMQANNSTSVALMLSQYYMAILNPFEVMYKKNLQEQQKKAQMGARPGGQQFPGSTSNLPRPSGIPNSQAGVRTNNMMMGQGLPGSSIPPTNGLPQFPSPQHQQSTQHRQPATQSLHQISSIDSHGSLAPSEFDSLSHTADSNLLDQDIQGIKRKHDQDDSIKRARQKTDPPDGNSLTMSMTPDLAGNPSIRQSSQVSSTMVAAGTTRQQASRRKIEYVPLAREVDTHGGRDLKSIETEWATLPQRRLREINEWGNVDIDAITMSIRSRLSIEVTYALTTITVVSTMRGQTPGSGFPISQCGDLLDELLDLMEELAFGEAEDILNPESVGENPKIVTNRELVSLVHDTQSRPFAPLERHQGSKDPSLGPKKRPGIIIQAVVNIIRNLSVISDNVEYLANHPRLVEVMLHLCAAQVDDKQMASPASKNLTIGDLVILRKDTLYILCNLAGLINLSRHPTAPTTLRLARRAFELVASYIIDPADAVSPLASVQLAGVIPNGHLKPPVLPDLALEVFTRLSQADTNRQVITKAVPQSSLWQLLTSLAHRLPIVDADFQLIQRDNWLSYVEKTTMAIYSLVFLAPPDLKQKIKTDRTLAFKNVMLRMAHKALMTPIQDTRFTMAIFARRAVETMKVLDNTEDLFDTSEPTMPILSFGMGFSDSGDAGIERGTGILGGSGDVAWEMLMLRDVLQDERMFNELDSLVRVEWQ